MTDTLPTMTQAIDKLEQFRDRWIERDRKKLDRTNAGGLSANPLSTEIIDGDNMHHLVNRMFQMYLLLPEHGKRKLTSMIQNATTCAR